MIPFFALIGLVTIISIIVNLQINRHSLFSKIIGTAILTFACIFACSVILFPLYFGSFQNLVVSFGIAFVLLIGIYVAAGLLANKRHMKNVVFVAADGDAQTPDADSTKDLAKPVQLRHVAAPKPHKIGRRTSRVASVEKEDTAKPEYRPAFSMHEKPKNTGRDLSMQMETGTIEEIVGLQTERIDGQTGSSVNPAQGAAEPRADIHDMEDEQRDSVVSDAAEAAELQTEPETSDVKAEQTNGVVFVAEDVGEQAETDIKTEQTDSVISDAEEAAELQDEQEIIDIDAEQTDSVVSVTEELGEQQAEYEIDIEAEQTDSVVSNAEEAELQNEQEIIDIDAEQTDSVVSVTEEFGEQQAEYETITESEQSEGVVSNAEEAELQNEQETIDIDAEQTDNVVSVTEELGEQQAEYETITESEQSEGMVSDAEEAAELQNEQETSDVNIEQTQNDESTVEEAAVLDDEQEDGETDVLSEDAAENDSEAEQTDGAIPAAQEDKYSRVINKALELKGQGEYLNTIFMLQSVYDNIQDEEVMKQADVLLFECFVLSKQYFEGQKKLFDILNKKYDFEPYEKAKLKAVMEQMNAGQL